ncbi:MAG: two-component regulator propeller domain-containing protein, partial [Verrucomicrobiota bacterium]
MVWLAGMAWVAGMAWAGPVGGGRGFEDDYVVEWHGMEQGLPGGGATSMAQDAAGYLWFATFQGLARFDGLEFKTYVPDNTPALPSDGVVSAYRDRQGRVWFSTYGGMVSLHEGVWRRHGKEDGWTASYARGFA